MDFSFVTALEELGGSAAFRIANAARPPADYLFNTILPEERVPSYNVDRGTLTVRSTMAPLVGMDSPYPPGGFIELDTFAEQTLKVGIEVGMPEAALRRLQNFLRELSLAGEGGTNETMVREAINFLEKVILQAHFDMFEWMRGQVLTTGALSFTQNKKEINVSYGVPGANLFATRTTASTQAYGASGSVFWTDVRSARRILKRIRAIVCHPNTADEIIYNSANNILVTAQGEGGFSITRHVGSIERPSPDARDSITLVTYDKEGEFLNPVTNTTEKVPFLAEGYVIVLGPNTDTGYRIGDGSTPDPDNDLRLGYTHIGPTVEGGGRPGRWADLYVPQQEPWRLHGRGVTNGLPVIENPKKLVVLSTQMAA
jgi:hypothetical protein